MATLAFLMFIPALLVCLAIMVPRIRMERRARALIAEFPNAERTSMYLAFSSGWIGGKHQEMEGKISEMSSAGWTFLRATEASPWRTLRSWGGGVNLEFIREEGLQITAIGDLPTGPQPNEVVL